MSFIASYEDGEPELKSADFLAQIADVLGPDYRQHEDRCFHWLTPLSQPEHEQVARQAHYAVSRLPEVLPGLDPRPTAEAWPVVLLADLEDQLAYHDLFPDSGETIIDGVQYLNRGYEQLEDRLKSIGVDVGRMEMQLLQAV